MKIVQEYFKYSKAQIITSFSFSNSNVQDIDNQNVQTNIAQKLTTFCLQKHPNPTDVSAEFLESII